MTIYSENEELPDIGVNCKYREDWVYLFSAHYTMTMYTKELRKGTKLSKILNILNLK